MRGRIDRGGEAVRCHGDETGAEQQEDPHHRSRSVRGDGTEEFVGGEDEALYRIMGRGMEGKGEFV